MSSAAQFPRRMIVGITGATGIVFGIRALEGLHALGVEKHAGAPVYPLKLSANRRYLVDQNNVPTLLQGTNQQVIMQESPVDEATYFRTRAAQGFNTNWCFFISNDNSFSGTNIMPAYDGTVAFPSQDLTAPNPAYFAIMDQIIANAAVSDIVLAIVPINDTCLKNNTWIAGQSTSAFSSFGTFLGNRYKNKPNIIWSWGNDFGTGIDPSTWNARDPYYKALHQAIIAADPSKLLTGENSSPDISLDDTNWNGLVNLNWAYCYVPTYYPVLRGYSYSPTTPVVQGEGYYEASSSHPTSAQQQRMQSYWALLSGACGQYWGDSQDVFGTDSWARSNLNTIGAIQQSYIAGFLRSIAWYNLVPDVHIPCTPGQAGGVGGAYPGSTTVTGHTFVTAGYGTLQVPNGPFTPYTFNDPQDFVAAALTPDGTLGVIYCPQSTTVTVAMSKMAGPTKARWYDPTTSRTYRSIYGAPLAPTGSHNFTTPGTNSWGDTDWVLLLQTIGVSPTPRHSRLHQHLQPRRNDD